MGMHPLHRAAANGMVDMVALLIEFGAEVGVRTVEGWTPLHCAARYAHEDVGKVLIDVGADKMAINSKGLTARQLAVEWDFPHAAGSF
jgi:ankyrin repeat protein